MLFNQLSDYHKASHLYKHTAEQFVVEKQENDKHEDELTDITDNEAGWESLIDVDIAGLRQENEDIAGWIYFENEEISYPVLYSGDNTTYLRKAYTGENVQAGSIFIDGDNSSDFSDVHTIIYGHNMKDLSMFGKLKNYVSDKAYIKDHEYFQVITEDRKYRYRIFAYKIVPGDSDVYTIYKNGSQDFLTFVNNVLKKGSYLYNDEAFSYDDHLVTLSTCSDENRFVLSAVRCGECNTK